MKFTVWLCYNRFMKKHLKSFYSIFLSPRICFTTQNSYFIVTMHSQKLRSEAKNDYFDDNNIVVGEKIL